MINVAYTSSRFSSRTLRSSLTSALGVSRSLGHAAGVDSWARVDVSAQLGVDVDENAWVSVLVCTRERNASWARAAAACNGDLVAGWVELGSVETAGDVQGDDFGAQQIVAWSDVGGDLDVDLDALSVGLMHGVRDSCVYVPRPQQFSMSLTRHQSLSP